MNRIISFFSGLLFAIGLGISGMTQPHVVQGFLDVFGNWDPRLIGVMVGAIAVHGVVYQVIRRRKSPVFSDAFRLPTKKDIDHRLILGAVIFGLGWGWTGICPGPGLVALMSGDVRFMIFFGALISGMLAFQFFERKFLR